MCRDNQLITCSAATGLPCRKCTKHDNNDNKIYCDDCSNQYHISNAGTGNAACENCKLGGCYDCRDDINKCARCSDGLQMMMQAPSEDIMPYAGYCGYTDDCIGSHSNRSGFSPTK